ncbi:hypothetical protein BH10BAC4_BH10BAC4_01020 [soil metagenome]
MKKLFYLGIIGLTLFEILNVYFIMPMPGSQRMQSLDLAYFLYSYRWYLRIAFLLMIAAGTIGTLKTSKYKWIPAISLLFPIAAIYMFNFRMSADSMFKQPEKLTFKPKGESVLNDSSIVVGVEHNGEVKAYPIRFIGYHHQVQDVIGGMPVIVTYCTVCRTGRVFEPTVKGQPEKFRLVGMDHFNAMFEDVTTKSWWRQATGEAVTGALKGEVLPEVESVQLTVNKLFELYPNAVVMQLDEASKDNYDSLARYERGKSKGALTRRDSLSWRDKSWVVGIKINDSSKAYDWNNLKEVHVINDKIGQTPVALVLSGDNKSFAAFERSSESDEFSIRNDTLFVSNKPYSFSGKDFSASVQSLKRIKSYQEFWHSWRTFHPETEQYK